MKNKRQEAIVELISQYEIQTQEELIRRLEERGFAATQATVSRDIRELKLMKGPGEGGVHKYTLPTVQKAAAPRFGSSLHESIVHIDSAENLIVVKTYPGMAQAIAAILDSAHIKGIMGSVAGDDTIIAAVRDNELTTLACEEIKKLLER